MPQPPRTEEDKDSSNDDDDDFVHHESSTKKRKKKKQKISMERGEESPKEKEKKKKKSMQKSPQSGKEEDNEDDHHSWKQLCEFMMEQCRGQQDAVLEFLKRAIVEFDPARGSKDAFLQENLARAKEMEEDAKNPIVIGDAALELFKRVVEDRHMTSKMLQEKDQAVRWAEAAREALLTQLDEKCREMQAMEEVRNREMASIVRKHEQDESSRLDVIKRLQNTATRLEEEGSRLLEQCQELDMDKKQLQEEVRKKDQQIRMFRTSLQPS